MVNTEKIILYIPLNKYLGFELKTHIKRVFSYGGLIRVELDHKFNFSVTKRSRGSSTRGENKKK